MTCACGGRIKGTFVLDNVPQMNVVVAQDDKECKMLEEVLQGLKDECADAQYDARVFLFNVTTLFESISCEVNPRTKRGTIRAIADSKKGLANYAAKMSFLRENVREAPTSVNPNHGKAFLSQHLASSTKAVIWSSWVDITAGITSQVMRMIGKKQAQ